MMKKIFICLALVVFVCGCASQFIEQRKISRPLVALGMDKINENDISSALIELHKAINANPSDPEVYYGFAMAYWKQAKYDKALENIDKAIAYSDKLELEHPGMKGESYNLKGSICASQKKYNEAIIYFKKALTDELYQTPYFSLYNLASIYLEKKELQLAYDTATSTLERNSHYAPAWHLLSKICVAQGKPSEALEALKHAILEFPGYTEAHFDLGQLYLKMGAREKAKEELIKVVELDPTGPYAALAADKLKNMK